MTHGRTAAIAGATGLVGGHLLQQLLDDAAYERVVVLVRRPPAVKHDKLEVREVDFDKLVAEALDVGDAFCALGTTIKKAGSKEAFAKVDFGYVQAFAKAARPKGSQLLMVSALGASARSSVFYNRTKGEIEEAVKALEFEGTHVFRPSFLAGERVEQRTGEKIGIAAARALGVIPLGFLKRMRPIEARLVAAAMIRVAKRDERGFHVYESEEIAAMA